MSTADAQQVYRNETALPESLEGQNHFSQQFDLAEPEKAMTSYQKLMHQHTKQQFEFARESSRRRSQDSTSADTVESVRSTTSVSSTAS